VATPPNDTRSTATALGPISPGHVDTLLVTGSQETAWFEFQALHAGTYEVPSPGADVSVFNARGKRLARGFGGIAFRVVHPNATVFVEVRRPVANESLTIARKKVTHAVSHPGTGARARPARPPGRSSRHQALVVHPEAESTAARAIGSAPGTPQEKPAETPPVSI
jgi:hypothetical protein